MNKIKQSLSTILLLSFLTSSVYGAENLIVSQNRLQKSMLNSDKSFPDSQQLQKTNIVDQSNAKSFPTGKVIFGVTTVGATLAAIELWRNYYMEKQKSRQLGKNDRFVRHCYRDIVGSYVELDEDQDAGWSYECDEYLIKEMAVTKYLLEKDGKKCDKKLLFPATLLRLFKWNGVLNQLRADHDEVNISLSFDSEDGWELKLSDNYEYDGIENELGKCYLLTAKYLGKFSSFYDDILKRCNSEIKNNKFLKEIFEKLYFIEFSIRHDGTLYCYAPGCFGCYDDSGYGLKLHFDHQF